MKQNSCGKVRPGSPRRLIDAGRIGEGGAPDLPPMLRRVPGLEVMQITGENFNVSIRRDNQLGANTLLVDTLLLQHFRITTRFPS